MANPKKRNNSRKPEADTEKESKATNRRGGKGKKDSAGSAHPGAGVKASSALLSAAANVSFPVAAGYPINLGEPHGDGVATYGVVNPLRIPGVMRLGYIPTFGPLKDWNSPANVWIRDWFTFIRHHNSGSANYDASALGFYGLSMRSCADYLTWMQRIYGVTKGSYVPANQYTPYDLVRACGGDYDDIIRHMADLRFYIASFAARLNIMKVPNFPFFSEGKELLNNVYADTASNKSSFYVFAPDGFWHLKVGTSPETTRMEIHPITHPMTYQEIIELGEELLNDILNSEDYNIMSGDIAKAYTDLWAPSVIDEDFTLVPVYDDGVLWQIHNASYLHIAQEVAAQALAKWHIHQNLTEGDSAAGAMEMYAPVHYPENTALSYEAGHACMLCFDKVIDLPADPTPSTVGAASRFMVICESRMLQEDGSDIGIEITIESCQCEVITSAMLITRPRGGFEAMSYVHWCDVSRFDLAPYLCTCQGYVNASTKMLVLDNRSSLGLVVGEVTNPSVLPKSVKDNIDMAVMLEKFGG